jgi:hypothetical protein
MFALCGVLKTGARNEKTLVFGGGVGQESQNEAGERRAGETESKPR